MGLKGKGTLLSYDTLLLVFRPPRPDIVCGNGLTAPAETRCRYDETEYRTVNGCRNLAHLQNCGMLLKVIFQEQHF